MLLLLYLYLYPLNESQLRALSVTANTTVSAEDPVSTAVKDSVGFAQSPMPRRSCASS